MFTNPHNQPISDRRIPAVAGMRVPAQLISLVLVLVLITSGGAG